MILYTKNIFLLFWGVGLLFLAIATPIASSQAETTIAVVDVEELMHSSDASESIQKQLSKEKERLEKSFMAEEDKLKAMEKDILSRKADMTEDEFNAEKKKFQKSLIEAKNTVQKQVDTVEKAAAQALAVLRKEIIKTIAEMADREKYTIVITKQNVILAEKELDITDKVMKELNNNIKTIKLKM